MILENARKVNEFDYNKMMADFESESRHNKILNGIKQKWRAVSCSYKEKVENIKKLNEKMFKERSRNLLKKLKKKEKSLQMSIQSKQEAKSIEKKKMIEQMALKENEAKLNIQNFLEQQEKERLQVEQDTELKSIFIFIQIIFSATNRSTAQKIQSGVTGEILK